ncbi:PGL/p-HBAD biosynthesis glycosyltransferase [Sporotomaculum syntrophicum]|uniref:4,4'-diaponeurosporenoate glycosyltransferase n=1 Tax=Sporotomaculum syntrophicum TaxID=182264 RepID=A0A9D2WMK4_9FIRM|nr:TIGR04283 family arsenosugar biosynthesis glycosyltransferase [Sporotomaculum syntrophicum]KAF1083963.1 PGL/p-HBAD biosynthesis glycosyltransferase [Sporotomaculum syntrophicum]
MKNNTPEISIIIPTYNEAGTIKTTIEHLKNLNGSHEVIVVDGGSTDSTLSLIGEEVKIIQSPKGRAVQMNAGAQAASGEILLFLHSDTKLPGNGLQQIKTALANQKVVGGAFKLIFDQPGLFFYLAALGSNLRAALTGIYFGDQAIFARRQDFLQVGGYPVVELMEDWTFSRKLRPAGKTVLLKGPVITSARRWLTYGKWQTAWLMHKIKFLYLLGVSPAHLERLYSDRHR